MLQNHFKKNYVIWKVKLTLNGSLCCLCIMSITPQSTLTWTSLYPGCPWARDSPPASVSGELGYRHEPPHLANESLLGSYFLLGGCTDSSWLRAHLLLQRTWVWVPASMKGKLITSCTSSSRGTDVLSGLYGYLHTSGIHTGRYT